MDWMEVAAYLINGVLVMAIVQYLKVSGMFWLKTNAPWSLPILALVAAQVLGFLAAVISGFLGYPIDFSAIAAVLTGSLAIVAYDTAHAARKVT